VSITVDPQTDTQQALRANADKLNADTERWSFCRHDDFNYIKRLSDDVLRVGGVNYQGHNNYVVVIDRDGEVAGMFNGYDPNSLERGVKLLEELLSKPRQHSEAAASSAEAA
jgi:cytochrome oxidase Cu insertion factor (SCO1/SenC/PrrC family)